MGRRPGFQPHGLRAAASWLRLSGSMRSDCGQVNCTAWPRWNRWQWPPSATQRLLRVCPASFEPFGVDEMTHRLRESVPRGFGCGGLTIACRGAAQPAMPVRPRRSEMIVRVFMDSALIPEAIRVRQDARTARNGTSDPFYDPDQKRLPARFSRSSLPASFSIGIG